MLDDRSKHRERRLSAFLRKVVSIPIHDTSPRSSKKQQRRDNESIGNSNDRIKRAQQPPQQQQHQDNQNQQKEHQEQQQQQQPQKRSVRFDINQNMVHENTLYAEEEIEELGIWYGSADFKRFKVTALSSARLSLSRKTPFLQMLGYLYDTCKTFDTDRSLEDILQTDEFAKIAALPDADKTSHVGMAQLILQEYGEDRKQRRKENTYLAFDHEYKKEETGEGLRRACELENRVSKLFALCLGNL